MTTHTDVIFKTIANASDKHSGNDLTNVNVNVAQLPSNKNHENNVACNDMDDIERKTESDNLSNDSVQNVHAPTDDVLDELPKEWKIYYDEHGVAYYHNDTLNHSQWEIPMQKNITEEEWKHARIKEEQELSVNSDTIKHDNIELEKNDKHDAKNKNNSIKLDDNPDTNIFNSNNTKCDGYNEHKHATMSETIKYENQTDIITQDIVSQDNQCEEANDKMTCENDSNESDSDLDAKNAEENAEENDEVIRIAVFGTTGVGKSTLCNLLCDANIFETSCGMNSCTDNTKSQVFSYVIDGKKIMFEVIDCPGFFDTTTILQNDDQIFQDNIRKCKHLTDNGISAYLLLIPYGRMLPEYAKSILFVRDYFPAIAAKYVWLILTKSESKNADEIFAEMKEGSEPKVLMDSLLSIIDNRYLATECKSYKTCNKKSDDYRKLLLTRIYQSHQHNNGPFQGNGLWTAFENQLKLHEQQKIANEKLSKENEKVTRRLNFLTILLIILAFLMLLTAYMSRQQQYDFQQKANQMNNVVEQTFSKMNKEKFDHEEKMSNLEQEWIAELKIQEQQLTKEYDKKSKQQQQQHEEKIQILQQEHGQRRQQEQHVHEIKLEEFNLQLEDKMNEWAQLEEEYKSNNDASGKKQKQTINEYKQNIKKLEDQAKKQELIVKCCITLAAILVVMVIVREYWR